LEEDGRFETLLRAIDVAGLKDTLNSTTSPPLTIFAPTEDAFDLVPEEALDELFEDRQVIKQLPRSMRAFILLGPGGRFNAPRGSRDEAQPVALLCQAGDAGGLRLGTEDEEGPGVGEQRGRVGGRRRHRRKRSRANHKQSPTLTYYMHHASSILTIISHYN